MAIERVSVPNEYDIKRCSLSNFTYKPMLKTVNIHPKPHCNMASFLLYCYNTVILPTQQNY